MRKKILIVEDEGELLRQYSQLLKDFGEVLQATNSKDALSMINKYRFDLLVLDNHLIRDPQFPQDIAGFRILKTARDALELDTPVILITGRDRIIDNIDVEVEVSYLRMCFFMEKPIDHQEFTKKVENILSHEHPGICKINNLFLLDWMKKKEKLEIEIKNYSPKKLNIKIYYSIINEIARRHIKCPGDTFCKDLIINSKHLDWILYLTEKRYRNHFEHQFNVGAFGWYLLDVEVEKGKTLRERILEVFNFNGEEWTDKQLNSSWWVASLLHDHAYPIAYLFGASFPMNEFLTDSSNKKRNSMDEILQCYNKVYRNVFATSFNALFVKSWENKVRDGLIDEIGDNLSILMNRHKIDWRKKNPYDHGILGAANIIARLKEEGFKRIDPVINEALVAIAFHNDETINNIRIDEHPIAFLLILCDQLQEWNRVIIRNDKYLTEFDNIALNLNRSEGGKFQFPERLKVRFEYKDEAILKETGWNYDLFLKSKRENIGRLELPKFFNPKGLDIEVLVLHQLR